MQHGLIKHARDEDTGYWVVECSCGWSHSTGESVDEATVEHHHHLFEVGATSAPSSGRTFLEMQAEAHVTARSKGWWDDQKEGGVVSHPLVVKVIPEKLALIHSEVSEALEDYRNGRLETEDDPVIGKPEGFATELADVVIRVMDLAGALGIDLGAEVERKLAYNKTRSHRHGGKRC